MLALLMAVSALLPAAAQPRKPAAAAPTLVLEGVWVGEEVGAVGARHPTVTFTKDGGTLAYEDAAGGTGSMTLRLQGLKVEAAQVRFAVPGAGKLKHFIGRWDGRQITGVIAADATGEPQLGTFSLRRPVYDTAPTTATRSSGGSPYSPAAAEGAESGEPAAAASAAPSQIETAREAGKQRLEERLARLSEQASELLQNVYAWQSSCARGTPMYDQPAVDCEGMIREVGRLAIAVGKGLDEAEDEARRSWVEPGTVRELRAQYGLDSSKWDELSSKVRQAEAEWKARRR